MEGLGCDAQVRHSSFCLRAKRRHTATLSLLCGWKIADRQQEPGFVDPTSNSVRPARRYLNSFASYFLLSPLAASFLTSARLDRIDE